MRDKINLMDDNQIRLERDLRQTQFELETELKKNVTLEEQMLRDRQQMTLMKNRIAFLECDIQNQKGEVQFLEKKKGDLIAENNSNVTKGDSLIRELKMADQQTKFVEE